MAQHLEPTFDFYTIGVTDRCNLKCQGCYRPPEENHWSLSFQQLQTAIDEIKELQRMVGKKETRILYSGGEVTLWKDLAKDKTFEDILIYTQEQGIKPRFDSNMVLFEDPQNVIKLLGDFSCRYPRSPFKVYASVDTFHANYDLKTNRCKSLDNLLQFRSSLPQPDSMGIEVATFISNNPNTLMPQEMVDFYRAKGIKWTIGAIIPWGKGTKLLDDAQLLAITGTDKLSLGLYNPFFLERLKEVGVVVDANDYHNMKNREIIKKLNVCGHTPNATLLWAGRYHYCIPQTMAENNDFVMADIGNLAGGVKTFLGNHSLLKEIHHKGIIEIADELKEKLTPISRKTIEEMIETNFENTRYPGCMFCIDLCKKGIWQEMNEVLLKDEK